MIYSSLILIIAAKVIHGLQHTCSGEDPLKVCRFNVKRLFIPFNEEKLDKVCRRLHHYYTCVHEHGPDLPTESELCGYALVLKKSQPLLRDLCRKGSVLNQRYLEYGTCLSDVQLDFGNFWYEAGKFAELYTKIEDDNEIARKFATCLTATQFLHFVSHFVMDKCREAAFIYARLLHDSEFHLLYCGSKEEYEAAEKIIREIKEGLRNSQLKDSSRDSTEPAYDRKSREVHVGL